MKILLAEHFGICFGVRDAIAFAQEMAQHARVTILGELVHNPIVREQLQRRGIEENNGDVATVPANTQVMITAHGASDARRADLRARGFNVADATCPLVHHAHTQLKRLVGEGYFPIVIGLVGHVEVRGLTEDFAHSIVVGRLADVEKIPSRPRYGIISQTTQPIEVVRELVNEIERKFPASEVRFVDTVCKPTKERQLALKKLIAQADTIVVVGGYASNNTRQLVETCRNGGRHVIHLERSEELRCTDFVSCQTVGVTAGTSTLPETIAAVVRRLEEISRFAPNPKNK
jgi:4-hydroxy-3-methylbut-2-enyl diphosphate reductase